MFIGEKFCNLYRTEISLLKSSDIEGKMNCFRNICHSHEYSQLFFSSSNRVKKNKSPVRAGPLLTLSMEFLEQCRTPRGPSEYSLEERVRFCIEQPQALPLLPVLSIILRATWPTARMVPKPEITRIDFRMKMKIILDRTQPWSQISQIKFHKNANSISHLVFKTCISWCQNRDRPQYDPAQGTMLLSSLTQP